MKTRLFWSSWLLLWVVACDDGGGGSAPDCTPGEVVACACPGGEPGERVCDEDGLLAACACPEDDGGLPDTRAPDRSLADAAPVDAAPIDALTVDAMPADAMPADAMPVDAMAPDAEPVDAMPVDAMAPDAEPVDAEPADALPVDAAPCVPDCAERGCGADGCGGVCGECPAGRFCDPDGQCMPEPPRCGDGACDPDEDCVACVDDCACIDGAFCDVEVARCAPHVCGDGRVTGDERCDDRNDDPDDGCDACLVVDVPEGGPCAQYPCADGLLCVEAVCIRPVCGDGRVEGEEQCDDGNGADGDGCEGCLIVDVPEGGPCAPDGPYACVEGLACIGGRCAAPVCGDGVVSDGEQCDDGNDVAGDGCAECAFDPFNEAWEPDDANAYPLVFRPQAAVLFRLSDGDAPFPDDLDYFSFVFGSPGHLALAVEGYPDGGCPDGLYLSVEDTAGDEVLDVRTGVACAFDTRSLGLEPLPADTYTIRVGHRGAAATGAIWLRSERIFLGQCEDGRDNDGDGLTDAADPGCSDRFDRDEADPEVPPACADGLDNDGDGLRDARPGGDPDCPYAGGDDEVCGRYDVIDVGAEGGEFVVQTFGRENRVSLRCGGQAGDATGPEAVLRLSLDAPMTLLAEVLADDFSSGLFLRDGCALESDTVACRLAGGVDGLPRLERALPAGVHYLFVDGYSGADGAARVRVGFTP